MPIQANTIDKMVIGAVASSIEYAQASGEQVPAHDAISDRDRLAQAIGRVTGIQTEEGHPFVMHRFEALRTIAYRQESRILHGARLFLESKGIPKQEIIALLKYTRAMGRQFGRVGGDINDEGAKADNHISDAVLVSPQSSLTYSPETGLDFSEPIKKLITACTETGTGCPLMGETVTWQGTKQSMFDMFWDDFALDYTNKYENNLPITFEYQG